MENARCRLKLDKGFFKYIKEKKDVTKVVIVLALGLILIFLGGRREKTISDTVISTEERIAAACSGVEGVGECQVYLYYSDSDKRNDTEKIESVIVVCEGADSVDVRLRLTEMLTSFFGIGSNRVRIEKMKG